MPGVSEAVVSGQVVYVSADGRFLMQGKLIDLQKNEDLTAKAENGLRVKALTKVGADQRISFPAQDEKHRVTIFTDVDCGYCRKLHQQCVPGVALVGTQCRVVAHRVTTEGSQELR